MSSISANAEKFPLSLNSARGLTALREINKLAIRVIEFKVVDSCSFGNSFYKVFFSPLVGGISR